MDLPVNPPQRQELATIIEALLRGELTRMDIVAWRDERLLSSSRTREEGGWELGTLLLYIDKQDKDGVFRLRDADIRELLAELRYEPGQTVDGFQAWRFHQIWATREFVGLGRGFGVWDRNHEIQDRLPLQLHRSMLDNQTGLVELLVFKLEGSLFEVRRDEDAGLWFTHVDNTPTHPLERLVTRLEIRLENLVCLDTRPAQLERQDDNGNTFLIRQYTNRMQALCERARLERNGHRQLYTVRLVDDVFPKAL